MCITSYVCNLVTPLTYSPFHTYAVGQSYSQYQQTVRSKPTADCQLVLNADCLATAFCFVAGFEQTDCYIKLVNYMPSLLALSLVAKSKEKSAQLSAWNFTLCLALCINCNTLPM